MTARRHLTMSSFQARDVFRRHGFAMAAEIAGNPDGIHAFRMRRTETPPMR